MTVLEVENLKKHFPVASGLLSQYFSNDIVHAVDGVDLSIDRGQILGLVGESGCGKSTLGRTILRLHTPTDGRIIFQGDDITDLRQGQLLPYRRNMQMVFQDPHSSLNPRQTVGHILTQPMKFHGIAKGKAAEERAIDLLQEVGMDADHLNRYPHEFSGGQQQRISIARALSVDPSFIVLDEPTSALDVSVQSKILKLIQHLQDSFDLTLILISHDLNVIRKVCDEVAVMYLGEIVEQASAADLFDEPYHPYTQALLNSIPVPDPDITVDRDKALTSDVPSPIDPPSGCRFHTRCPEVMDHCKEENPSFVDRTKVDAPGSRCVGCHLYEPTKPTPFEELDEA